MALSGTIPPLDFIINANNFQKIQDCLSEASDMAIVTVDFQGNPVTRHSQCSEYCSLVRSLRPLNDLCRKCDSRGGLEASRLGKPYIYLCHMGVLDLAVPIVVGGQYTGALMAGQVLLKDENDGMLLEKIVDSRGMDLAPAVLSRLERLRVLLPSMTKDRVQVVANMMFQITNYIIEEALAKINLNEAWEASVENLAKTARARSVLSSVAVSTRPVYNSLILKPALDYIQNNFEKSISLEGMASLCNISSSYFSKLFNKITGSSFANYINLIRVERACELLIGTDTPITVIALDLGFDDSSYFNRVFKRLAGVSPSQYRAGKKKS